MEMSNFVQKWTVKSFLLKWAYHVRCHALKYLYMTEFVFNVNLIITIIIINVVSY